MGRARGVIAVGRAWGWAFEAGWWVGAGVRGGCGMGMKAW